MSETFSFRVYVRIETGLVSYFQSSTLHLFFSQRNGSRPMYFNRILCPPKSVMLSFAKSFPDGSLGRM